MQNKERFSAALAVLLALALVPVAEAQTQVRSGFNMFSPEQDVQIGRQAAGQIERQVPLVGGSAQSYVDQIGQKLARQAPGPRFGYRFRVVNASDLNAFALPGGYIYLNRGIIEAARTEGEVAGVLAHEIAHVALRHGTQNVTKAQVAQTGAGILGSILGGKVSRDAGQVINIAGGVGLNALFLKYSREAERDADILGAQILARAGYNPMDMVSFFQTLERSDRRQQTSWFHSHPAPPQRAERVRQEARMLGASTTATTGRTQRLSEVQSSLRRMPAARPTSAYAR
jgi:beta-barrel assembly-enhancing protease